MQERLSREVSLGLKQEILLSVDLYRWRAFVRARFAGADLGDETQTSVCNDSMSDHSAI